MSVKNLRKAFLVFTFLAFFIDNPFTAAFGEYEALTEIPSIWLFGTISYHTGIPIPFSVYEWFIILFSLVVWRNTARHEPLPSGIVAANIIWWIYVASWLVVSVLFLRADTQAIYRDFNGIVTIPFVFFTVARLFPEIEMWSALVKTFSLVIFVKCVQALFLYFFVWESGYRGTVGYILDHAASFQISTVILLVIGAIVFGAWRPQRFSGWMSTLLFMIVLSTVYLLNERRTEMVGLLISLALFGGIAIVKMPRASLALAPFILAGLGFYVAIFSGSQSMLAFPLRIFSLVSDDHDLSNVYRAIENYNLVKTILVSSVFGQGFGVPMHDYAGLVAFLSGDFYLLHPHNSLLWFWMAGGICGISLFMLLIAVFSYHAVRIVLSTENSLQILAGSIVIANIFRYLIFCYGDQLILHSSSSFVMGATFAAIAAARYRYVAA